MYQAEVFLLSCLFKYDWMGAVCRVVRTACGHVFAE